MGSIKAMITGASSGLGKMFARKLAQRGYDLAITARREDLLRTVADDIQRMHDVTVDVMVADLTQHDDLNRLEEYLSQSTNLALLVNNAGFGLPGKFIRSDLTKNIAMIQTHILAAVRLTRAVLPGMIQRKDGGIINVSSFASLVPIAGNATYASTKAYLNTFSTVLALELYGSGVKVQSLCPGFTRTGFHRTSDYKASDIDKQVPGWMWMDASTVVETSLKAFERGKPIIVVPGWKYRILYLLANIGLAGFMSQWMSSRR